jgi:hypothetical protein
MSRTQLQNWNIGKNANECKLTQKPTYLKIK